MAWYEKAGKILDKAGTKYSPGYIVLKKLAEDYSGAAARGASAEELARMAAIFEKIKPPEYDLSISAPPKLHEERLQSPKFSGKLDHTNYEMSKLKPEEYKVIGKYSPEIPKFIKEEAPKLIEQSEGMKKGREAQMNALRRLTEVGSGEFDPQYQEMVSKASRAAQNEAQSRGASLIQDFARRGQGGSGISLAAQIGSNAKLMDSIAEANQSAASESYRNRLNALVSGAELGGRISGEDIELQQRNNDLINSFNQRMASGRQRWENDQAGALNEAQRYNLGVGQRISDTNVGNRNEAEMYNRRRMDEIARERRGESVSERDREDRLAQILYERDREERDYYNRIQQAKYENSNEAIDRINRMKSRQYEDQMRQAEAQAGISRERRSDIIREGQDKQAKVQALINLGVQGAMAYGSGGASSAAPAAAAAAGSYAASRKPTGQGNSYGSGMYGRPVSPQTYDDDYGYESARKRRRQDEAFYRQPQY